MASVVLRLFTNIYSYFVVYVLTASWLGSLGAVYLPFRLSLNTDLGLLILSAFSLTPIAGKYRIMHKPDRIGAIVLAFAVFVFYLTIATFLRILGFTSLPLGTLDSVVFLVLVAIYIPTLTLYAIRQRKRSLQSWRFWDESNRSSKILFSEFSSFHVGNKDLKPRTGSWRVLQILATINLAVWVGVAILIWLGVGPGNGYWSPLSIGAFAQLFFSVFTLAYLNLYHLPQKKSSTQPW